MNVKDRIVEFYTQKKIAKREFERMCGLSNGYIDKLRNCPSNKKLEIIYLQFPELNPVWLMTGKGEMLVPDADAYNKQNGDHKSLNDKKKRLSDIIGHLRGVGRIRTQKEFAESIGFREENISRAIKGDHKYLTDGLFDKIFLKYKDVFREEYVRRGVAPMLIEDSNQTQTQQGGHNKAHINLNSYINAEDNFRGMIDLQKGYQELLRKKDEQIDNLMEIIKTYLSYGK